MGGRPSTKKDCQSAGQGIHDGYYDDAAWTIEFFLRDEIGFYDSVAAEMGRQRGWITFGDVDCGFTCADRGDGVDPPTHTQPCSKVFHKWRNTPVSVNKNDIHVANPKTIIEAAMPNMTALADTLMVGFLDMVMGISDAEGGDIVTAASMPIFMLQQAIDSMQQVKDIGSRIIEKNKKKLISLILSIVLMATPFIGEAGGALFGGVAMIARIAALVDIVENTALTAYDIIDDPESAPFAILGLLVGGFGTGARSEKDAFQEAGKARKSLSPSNIAKLGDTFVRNDAKVQKVINACARTS
ncbi:hypothetical protein GE09DRAFT_120035 [Coniochaeta sp. 2T2.1]|nr:hypothetical protein GE09DRAFT_120035 [Coniochaeta sp. 2T2.1]